MHGWATLQRAARSARRCRLIASWVITDWLMRLTANRAPVEVCTAAATTPSVPRARMVSTRSTAAAEPSKLPLSSERTAEAGAEEVATTSWSGRPSSEATTSAGSTDEAAARSMARVTTCERAIAEAGSLFHPPRTDRTPITSPARYSPQAYGGALVPSAGLAVVMGNRWSCTLPLTSTWSNGAGLP